MLELPSSGWLVQVLSYSCQVYFFSSFLVYLSLRLNPQQIMSVANIYLLSSPSGWSMDSYPCSKVGSEYLEWTPVYHVNELVVNFAIMGNFHGNHFLFILAYTVVATGLALFIKSKRK